MIKTLRWHFSHRSQAFGRSLNKVSIHNFTTEESLAHKTSKVWQINWAVRTKKILFELSGLDNKIAKDSSDSAVGFKSLTNREKLLQQRNRMLRHIYWFPVCFHLSLNFKIIATWFSKGGRLNCTLNTSFSFA